MNTASAKTLFRTAMLASIAIAGPVRAIVIDDFSTPQGPLVAVVSTTLHDTVEGDGILGGTRMVSLRGSSLVAEVAGGAFIAHNETGSAPLTFRYHDRRDGEFGFDPTDFTDGGVSDRILLDFSEVQNGESCTFAYVVEVELWDIHFNVVTSGAVEVDGPGVFEFPFSDLTKIQGGNEPFDITRVIAVTIPSSVVGICTTGEADPAPTTFSLNHISTGGAIEPPLDDADGDGVLDDSDLCPSTAAGPVDAAGCSDAQVDGDADGYCNVNAPAIGPSACTGTDNCPTVFNPDQADSNGDGYGDACVDPSVDIPDNADVDPTATIGAGSDVDKGAIIGAGVDIGENVDVKQNVAIGDNSSIGDGSTIDQNATIGANVTIGAGVRIGRGVVIEDGAVIGDFAFIDRGAFIGANAHIEPAASIGRDAVICTTARVETGLVLGRNALVQTGVVQAGDIPGSPSGHSPAECTAPP